jgi:heptaprenyl diphosphate synthase
MASKEHLHFDDMVKRTKSYVTHPFLTANGVEPSISRFHFDVSQALLTAAEVSKHEAEQVMTAVLLLHQGLSIHDTVDDIYGKRKQLTVLAGDFSSGHYYHILAHIPNTQLLSALCEAVVQVNEAKMTLIATPDLSPRQYADLHETIHGALLYALATFYFPDSTDWESQVQALVRGFIADEHLLKEQFAAHLTWRQALEWLTEVIERLIKAQGNALLQPISALLVDYLITMQHKLETQSLTERNHTW